MGSAVIATHCVGKSGGGVRALDAAGEAAHEGVQVGVEGLVGEPTVDERLERGADTHGVLDDVGTGDLEHLHAVLTGPLRRAGGAGGGDDGGRLAGDGGGAAG